MRRRKKIVSIQSNSAFVTTNAFVDLAISLLFSGEEGYGRYLDLYAHHTAYNNLKGLNKRLAYLQYLDVLCARSTILYTKRSLKRHDTPEITSSKLTRSFPPN